MKSKLSNHSKENDSYKSRAKCLMVNINSCNHELDPNTEKFRNGHICGKCKKCGCTLIRTRAIETAPKRVRPKMNKKERRRVNKLMREDKSG